MMEMSIPTGGPLHNAAQRLLDASLSYLTIYQETLGPDAVVYLKDTDGRVVIVTRGEYTDALMEGVGVVREMLFQSADEPCPDCNHGLRSKHFSPSCHEVIFSECETCNGTGKLAAEPPGDEDEYPECADCRNTGHPWVDGCDMEHSGYDHRFWCDCPQGQDMKAANQSADKKKRDRDGCTG